MKVSLKQGDGPDVILALRYIVRLILQHVPEVRFNAPDIRRRQLVIDLKDELRRLTLNVAPPLPVAAHEAMPATHAEEGLLLDRLDDRLRLEADRFPDDYLLAVHHVIDVILR